MNQFDSRLDKRTYEEMSRNIDRWESVEEKAVTIFCSRYVKTYGGEARFEDNGYRRKGLERNVKNVDIEPDFRIYCTCGPIREATMEVQAMEPDYRQFHIKEHKIRKAIETNSLFLHMSAMGKNAERFAVVKPETLNRLTMESIKTYGIVGFPGTRCEEFPDGKPSYRFRDDAFVWNYSNRDIDIAIM